MLETLRRIVEEVSSAENMDDALNIVVARVKESVETSACTIYLLDNRHGEYVMMATMGLNPKAVRRVRIGLSEGLIGLVGQREEPISVEDAPAHPKFLYDPSAGEELYKAFLGVPIIHHRNLLGVLVIQHVENRRFDQSEEAFLITLSAQLAGVIAHAQATGKLTISQEKEPGVSVDDDNDVATFGGVPCVPGVAIGTAVTVYSKADLSAVPEREADDIEQQINQMRAAIEATRDELRQLRARLQSTVPEEEQALFDMYLSMLDKASLEGEITAEIEQGHWAQGALRRVVDRHVKQFAAMDDSYLRERATDIKDIGRRVLSHLQQQAEQVREYPSATILVGDEVSAADVAEVPEGCLIAVVSASGSVNSHVAILARAMRIPTVMSAQGQDMSQLDSRALIVDGYYGHVYVEPSEELLEEYELLAQEEQELDANLQTLRDMPTQTPDGHYIDLNVNTGLGADASLALSVGAAGVGLFRSELSFMGRDSFPVEEEQTIIYRQVLKAFAPRPVVIRTLDIGGDKFLPYFPVVEANPFLGWRGIRVTLDHPEVFLLQARAMMRASEGLTNLRIMLPMISSVSELDEALVLLNRAYDELLEEGIAIRRPQIGVMIEVPSAVYQVAEIARRVDFLSVGSNDLIQYLLAVDRNNSRVADLYEPLHPAVLQALQQIVTKAHQEKKPVSLCGEMASDPVAVIILLALGFDSLSMNAGSLLRIKWVIRNISMAQAQQLLKELITFESPALIRFRLEQALDEAGLGGLIRAGKQ